MNWFSGIVDELAADPFKATFVVIFLVIGVVYYAWTPVKFLFDPVVRREHGHVVAVDLSVDKHAVWKGNEDPLSVRLIARMSSGEELSFGWKENTFDMSRAIKKQVFTQGGYFINLNAPKINADPRAQKAAIAHMKDHYFRFWLPQPQSVVVKHRKSGGFSWDY